MNQKIRWTFAIFLALTMALGTSVTLAKSDKEKTNQGKNNSKSVNLKNFKKPDKAKGETNAQIHREKIKEVVQNLEQVANQEEEAGHGELRDQVAQVIQEQQQTQEQTAAAIGQVEKRGKIKTFLVGTDYKNLGQLRSSLVHNRNEIRKLTQTSAQVQSDESRALIEAQLAELMRERERIKAVITENQESFSLFGWVSRFLNDYEQIIINEQEETDLTEEVENVINTDPADNQETTQEVAPISTTVTETVPTQ